MKLVIDLWSGTPESSPLLNDMEDDQAFFKVAARQNGLLIQRVEGDFDSLLKLNLPAVLEFYLQGGGTPRYLTSPKPTRRMRSSLVGRWKKASRWTGAAHLLLVPRRLRGLEGFLNLPGTLSLRIRVTLS